MSTIEWTEKTWNPVSGCSRVSPGCDNCYAMHFEHRFSGEGQRSEGLTVYREGGSRPGVDWSGKLRFRPKRLDVPFRRRRPTLYFVNSTSDLFHPAVSNLEIAAVFGVMATCERHTFQILTKRADRMRRWFEWAKSHRLGPSGIIHDTAFVMLGISFPNAKAVWRHARSEWPLPNVWLGVSCEDQQRANERIPELLATPAALRFVSAEPLLGPIRFADVPGLNKAGQAGVDLLRDFWVIVGGESGPGARPCNAEHIRSIVDQCRTARVACFVKQLGRFAYADKGGRDYCRDLRLHHQKGADPSEWPEDLRVREFPRLHPTAARHDNV